MNKGGKLIVITGPSGVGKSTIVRQVLSRTGAQYSVSVTTRRKREGETDGRDYRFIDRRTFQRMIDAGELMEWAEVFGDLYGTPLEPVEEALAEGKSVILEIDVQGGMQVHRKMPDAVCVLILPPSEVELARRLSERGSENEDALKRRLAKASAEVRAARSSCIYDHVVVNEDLEEAIRSVVEIVRGSG